MNDRNQPFEITFPSIGDPRSGYISLAECQKQVPFDIKRVYWTYATPETIARGRHAHHETEQILIAVSGQIILTTLSLENHVQTFLLNRPDVGVFIPKYNWHIMTYSEGAVQLVLASTEYRAEDYIREFEDFKALCK